MSLYDIILYLDDYPSLVVDPHYCCDIGYYISHVHIYANMYVYVYVHVYVYVYVYIYPLIIVLWQTHECSNPL